MPFLVLLTFTLLATCWTYRNAQQRRMAARGWALATALSSGLTLPVYLAVRKPAP